MNKTFTVARREYLYNLKRPSFLFAVFGVPLFTIIVMVLIFAVTVSNEENLEQVGRVGYVDQSGILADPVFPEDATDRFTPYPDETAARQALDEKTIGAYVIIPASYITDGEVSVYSYEGVPEALNKTIETLLLQNITRQVSVDMPLERIQEPVNMTIHVADSGRDLTEDNIPALILMPMMFALVFMMASGVTSGFLMSGVVEEKTNRIMEILVTSVTPTQILLGKVIGLGLLGLTQIIVWGVGAVLLFTFGQTIPALQGMVIPTDLMLLFFIYFVLSYFLLSSLMAGIGAVVGSEQESRQISSIVSLLWVLPFFFVASFLSDPNGVVPLILTLVPFTAPTTVLMRMGFAAVPAWQVLLSLAILLLTALVTVWASGRIFRWALLRYGKHVGWRELLRVLRKSPDAEISMTTSAQEGAR